MDLSKAYDRVDWDFLEQALVRRGLSPHLISMVMECVRFVKYSAKFNGHPMEQYTPSRELHQGDPLLPLLFLLVADALSALLHNDV